MAFGGGSKALLVTSTAIFLVDPTTKPPTFVQQASPAVALTAAPLPTTFGTYPPQILQASIGVSGDQQTIIVLAQGSVTTSSGTPAAGTQLIIKYNVASGALTAVSDTSTPTLGPRVVSVDRHGVNFVAGWSLFNQQYVLLAEYSWPSSLIPQGR